jgi:hypothetical protein
MLIPNIYLIGVVPKVPLHHSKNIEEAFILLSMLAVVQGFEEMKHKMRRKKRSNSQKMSVG